MTRRAINAWRDLKPGDFMHTKAPLATLERTAATLAAEGYAFKFEQSPTGHFVLCRRAPSPQEAKP